jgi:hypothetical protein
MMGQDGKQMSQGQDNTQKTCGCEKSMMGQDGKQTSQGQDNTQKTCGCEKSMMGQDGKQMNHKNVKSMMGDRKENSNSGVKIVIINLKV